MKKTSHRPRMRIGLKLEEDQSYIYNTSMTHAEVEKMQWYRILAIKKSNVFRIIIAALIFNFAVAFFLTPAETIPTGISGIGVILVFLVPQLNAYFGVLFLVLNAPILIIYWKRNSNVFNVLTAFYLLSATFINSILNIREVNDFFMEVISFVPGWSIETINSAADAWPIVLFAFIAAIILGISGAILWQAEASTAGTDIIVKYYSTKYKKSVGGIARVFGLSSGLIFYLFYIGFRWNIINSAGLTVRSIFVIQFFSTVLYIIISTITINFLYPNYKKAKVSISTNRPQIAIDYFKKIEYWRGYTIFEGFSAYTGRKTYRIETVCLVFEAKIIIKDLKRFDSSIWITTQNINSVFGNFK